MRKLGSVVALTLGLLLATTAVAQASALPQRSVQAMGERGTFGNPTLPAYSFVLKAQATSKGATGGTYSLTLLSDGSTVVKGSITCVSPGISDSSGNPAILVSGVIKSGSSLSLPAQYFAVGVAVGPSSSFVTLTGLDTTPIDCTDSAYQTALFGLAELPILNGFASIKVKS